MPIIINEIVIKTNIEKNDSSEKGVSSDSNHLAVGEMVRQAVEQVMELLEEKKQR